MKKGLIAYSNCEGQGELGHPLSLDRTFAVRSSLTKYRELYEASDKVVALHGYLFTVFLSSHLPLSKKG